MTEPDIHLELPSIFIAMNFNIVTTNVVTVGLAIESALVRQRKVAEATRRTREFLGEFIAVNASATKRHTSVIGDLQSDPVTAIGKMTQAHDDLVKAIDAATRLRHEAVESASRSIAEFSRLLADLRDKVATITVRPGGPESIEA